MYTEDTVVIRRLIATIGAKNVATIAKARMTTIKMWLDADSKISSPQLTRLKKADELISFVAARTCLQTARKWLIDTDESLAVAPSPLFALRYDRFADTELSAHRALNRVHH